MKIKKGIEMKVSTLTLMAAITVIFSPAVTAESAVMMPPPGPYRMTNDIGQYVTNQNAQNYNQEERNYAPAQFNQQNRDVPDWVRQRRTQMEQTNMPQMQRWNEPQSQWYNGSVPPAQNGYPGSAQGVNMHYTRMQQPMPVMRGPVYGPEPQPREYYQQPGYPVPQY